MDSLLYNSIASTNNSAVDLLKEHDYESAIQQLQMVFELLSTRAESTAVWCESNHGQQHRQQQTDLVSFDNDSRCQSSWFRSDLLEIFDGPCSLLHVDPTSSSCIMTETLHIVLFNLGLCFHLWAMESANRQTHRLQKALHLYQHVLVVLDQAPQMDSWLNIVVYNNMACIYMFSFRKSEASECLIILANLIPTGISSPILQVNIYAHCEMNVIMAKFALTSSAPAA